MPSLIKVAIDSRDLKISKTGARTYLEEICKEFLKGHEGFSFILLDSWFRVYTGNNKIFKIIEHGRFFIWKQIVLPIICRIRRCNVLFCTDYFLPLFPLGVKTYVVFHDAFFWQYPKQYNKIWFTLVNSIGILAAKKATAILTVTEYSKTKIIEYTGLDENKIHVVYLAPKTRTVPIRNMDGPKIHNRKYILHVGVFEKRKNLTRLIRAFYLLTREGYNEYDLILVGNCVNKEKIDDSRNIYSLITELGLTKRVILPGFASDDQLINYYMNATVFAFVSLNEGFGIPILESFFYKVPVLVANNSCLTEVGGDAVITCNPMDEVSIKNNLKTIIDNPSLQKEMIIKGEKRLANFTWEKTSREILDIFRKFN